MRHNPYYSFIIIHLFLCSHYQSLYWQNVYQATSLQSQYTFTQLLSKVFLNKCNKTFSCNLTWSIDKMHYEEELDLFCRCIRANISIMLHKTIYEINSTLLLRTHFKPPLSVCNNFLLRSHVEFGCLLLLKYAFYSLLYRCKNEHFRYKLHIHLKKIT